MNASAAVLINHQTALKAVLRALSKHGVAGVGYTNSSLLLRAVAGRHFDLIFVDYEVKGIGLENLLAIIRESQPASKTILYSAARDEVLAYIEKGYVFGFFSNPNNSFEIEQLILIALKEIENQKRLESELERIRRRLKAGSDIEKAKEVLALQKGISLQRAYEAMRRASMDAALPLEEVARRILRKGQEK